MKKGGDKKNRTCSPFTVVRDVLIHNTAGFKIKILGLWIVRLLKRQPSKLIEKLRKLSMLCEKS